jgi:DNA polymerase V
MDILGSSSVEGGVYGASPHDQSACDDGRANGSTIAVHAGFPNPAADRTGAPLSLDKLLVRHPSSTFFFRIRGHNWRRYGVFDGDLAVIDRAIIPRAEQLVVWWYETGDFALGPLAKAEQQTVWGAVTAIIHSFTAQTQPTQNQAKP